MPDLFSPLQLGNLELPNRVLYAPLTRCRAEAVHGPGALMAEYYAQRATASLLIAKATMVSEGQAAFGGSEPGIHKQAQVQGWRLVRRAARMIRLGRCEEQHGRGPRQ